MRRLALLQLSVPATPGPLCPSGDAWTQIAAGLTDQNAEEYLSHAVECDHCGRVLAQLAYDLREELAPEEEDSIARLHTSTPRGLREIAAMLNASPVERAAERAASRPRQSKHPRFSWLTRGIRIALGAAAMVLIAAGIWLAVRRADHRSAEQLVWNAYAEKRTIEMQIEGAPYAPLSQERGQDQGAGRMRRPALLKAETAISETLKTDPDSAEWLQAEGRVNLLEDNPQAAIDSLEEARRLEESSESIKVDLASAYLLRGESATRPEDVGTAVELLNSVLAAQPHNAAAQFNCALALERLQAKVQAIAKWEQFLQDHPQSSWDQEARAHLEALRQQALLRKQRSERPLLTPEQISAEGAAASRADEIDSRIEEYQDLAAQQWLPDLAESESRSASGSPNLKRAIESVAALLEQRHGDKWLREISSAMSASPKARQAVELMSESERQAQASDDDRALGTANRAYRMFQEARVPAGALRSRFDIVYIRQFLRQSQECEQQARSLALDARARGYIWIRIQSQLEAANCDSLDDEPGLRFAQDAQRQATEHGFRILSLRAANAVSALFLVMGDLHSAWAAESAGMQEYWAGSAPAIRGYCLLATLDDLAEEQNQSFLSVAVLNELLPMAASSSNQAIRAADQARLGDVLLRIGDVAGAERSFKETQRIFEDIPSRKHREVLQVETDIGLANAQIEQGNYRAAVDRLEAIRPVASQVQQDDLRLSYFQASGIACMRLGDDVPAQKNLMAALQLAEGGLRIVNTEDDRIKWSRRNEPLYRAMVEFKLRKDPQQALAYWEWYKSASLRARSATPGNADPAPDRVELASVTNLQSRDAAFVSYVIFPKGISVWVVNQSGIRQRWIDVSEPALSSLVHRFVEHCSNPDDREEKVRSEGAAMYRLIFLPIESWIEADRRLIVETDGVLCLLPLQALVDERGSYLGDRFQVSVSPGMRYQAESRKWNGLSPESTALVVGDPAARNWASLPGAEQEAREVAAHFNRSHLVLDANVSSKEIAKELPHVDVFHFSGHASAGVDASGMVLGDASLFQARNLLPMRSARTQLAVLSACASARGTTGFFDDEDSFVQQLAAAGVPEIVASRWNVDSSATAVLMRMFYAGLMQGRTVPDALREATRSVRANPRYAHPFYWAAFEDFGRG